VEYAVFYPRQRTLSRIIFLLAILRGECRFPGSPVALSQAPVSAGVQREWAEDWDVELEDLPFLSP
jgi:hypothetical protein